MSTPLEQAAEALNRALPKKGDVNNSNNALPSPNMPNMLVKDEVPVGEVQFGEDTTLGKLSKAMEPNAFGVLIDLVNWAMLWDQIYESAEDGNNVMKFDNATIRSMMAPFLGFGNNPRLWGVVAQTVTALVGRELPLWMGDPAYRKSHSMVWCILQSVAPSLAASSHGYNGQMAVVEILKEGFKQ